MVKYLKACQVCFLLHLTLLHFDTRLFSNASVLREFLYAVCTGKRYPGGVIGAQKVTSLLECVTECSALGDCRSASVCKESEGGRVCRFSTTTVASCDLLTTDTSCSFVQMTDPCENGGLLDKATMTCACPIGLGEPLCQLPAASSTPETLVTTTKSQVSNACLSGAACSGASPKSSVNGVTYCCPSEFQRISSGSRNGVMTCTCS